MSDAAKKQRNRQYYLKNRERILNRAKERKNNKRRPHLEIVHSIEFDNASVVSEAKAILVASENVQAVSSAYLLDSTETSVAEKFEPRLAADRFQPKIFFNSTASQLDSAVFQISKPTETLTPAQFMLEMKPEISEFSFNIQFEVASMERSLKLASSLVGESETLAETKNTTENAPIRKLADFFSFMPLSFIFRLLLITCVTVLMTAMQVAFYREHDILPGYAVPLALVSELAFLSLVTMKFSRGLEWLRIIIHLIFFAYFVSALSFHVYVKSRAKAASMPSLAFSETTVLEDQLKQAERSLEVAIKGRAWKSMEVFGVEISRLRKQIVEIPRTQVLGTSSDQTLWIEAILLILLRALLLAASALNVLKLRDQICEIANRDTCRT